MSTYEPETQFKTKKYKCQKESILNFDNCIREPILGYEGCIYYTKS